MDRPYKIPESVLVVIHTAQLDVLLIERADSPGFWQSVTGSKDSVEEDLEQTAVREVAEEWLRQPEHLLADQGRGSRPRMEFTSTQTSSCVASPSR